MIRNSFNHDWTIVPQKNRFFEVGEKVSEKSVTLPYDAMIQSKRDANAPSGSSTGYYPDMVCTTAKKFEVPAAWEDKTVILEFEGVYTNSMVYINGDYAGGCPHGYTNFYIEANPFLQFGKTNEIKVTAKTCKDSRWYSGVGIYRNVKLMVSDLVHIVPDSYRVTIAEADDAGALIEVSYTVENRGYKTVEVSAETQLTDADGGTAATMQSTVTMFAGQRETLRQRVYLDGAHRWSIDTPYLYTASTALVSNAETLDCDSTSFGVRTLALDARHGLRINGQTVKLRGACVHHDNGPIGAAAIERAEERRVELLKAAGFNAVRSAHNPISKAFLNACDKYGVVVMDEVSDMWTRAKCNYDFSTSFPHFWETACEHIVAKDFNHPCVVMYSIGNEIPETGTPHGAKIGRAMAEKIRSMDETRYVINSINTMLSIMDKLQDFMPKSEENAAGEINQAMTDMSAVMSQINGSEIVTRAVKEAYDSVDIAGYNYATVRYAMDEKMFPNRVLCGSETMPMQIAENWAAVKKYSHVIGDFTWTGWDYIGEAGIGKMEYQEDGSKGGFCGDYPWSIAYCGDIDVTGLRRPISYYREIVFGLRTEPYLAVDYPQNYGKTLLPGMWNSFDAISSWTWANREGQPVRVHVFGDGDCFALQCNKKEICTGTMNEYRGFADIPYERGELVAVVYRDGKETGRTALHTAKNEIQLTLCADRSEIRADDTDLAYVAISLADTDGVVDNTMDCQLKAQVSGAGVLLGFGTGYPKSRGNFTDDTCLSFDGHALAVIRPTQAGEITLTVTADGLGTKSIVIMAR